MAMTQLVLVFMASLATAATALSGWMAINSRRVDKLTRVPVTFGAAILWGIVGMSSFDVVVTSHVNPPVSEPIPSLAYVGIGLAMLVGLYAVYDLIVGISAEASEAGELLNP